jgi:DNA-cytosine methyltransferase
MSTALATLLVKIFVFVYCNMKYLSLFSGIGGFEVAIQNLYGNNTECLAFAEIDKHAIKVYESHYPLHKNLGNVTMIKKKHIVALGSIDLIVAGFPCNDLSSLGDRTGLHGKKSGLFWHLLQIIKWGKCCNSKLQICIENNASMSHKWRDVITLELSKAMKQKVVCNYVDSSLMVVQRRRRYFWTLTAIPVYKGPKLQKNMKDILDDLKYVKHLKISSAILDRNNHDKNNRFASSSSKFKIDETGHMIPQTTGSCWGGTLSIHFARTLTTSRHDSMYYEVRGRQKFVRYWSPNELHRLSGFADSYCQVFLDNPSILQKLFGMTVIVPVVEYVISSSILLH